MLSKHTTTFEFCHNKMNGKELEDEYYLTFVDGGDGIHVDHKSIILESAFVVAFETGEEDESGDVTKPEFVEIWKTIENFRQVYDDLSIDVTITSPKTFHYEIEDWISEGDFSEMLEVSDSSWNHDFYIFVTFKSR